MIQRFTCRVDVVDNNHSLELSFYPAHILPQRECVTNICCARGASPSIARPRSPEGAMSMKIQIKGRNVTVTDAMQDYANEEIEHVHNLLQQRTLDEVT